MTKVTGILALLLFATLATALSLVVVPTMWGVRIASSAWRKVKHSFVTEIVPLTSSDLTEIEICSDAPIVYLIHGTFAPAASWTHEKSPLCQALMGSQSANNDAPILQRIQWGGANTVAARLDGISQLRERLARIVAVNPSRRVALIGHSHGGNIALKAAEAFTEMKSLNIVTMATPFLLAQKRPMALVYRLLAPALSGLLVC